MKKGRVRKSIKTFGYMMTHPEAVFKLVYACKIQYPSLYKKLTDDVSDQKKLDMIGKIQQTDKASALLRDSEFDSANDYLRHYDMFFSQIRGDSIRLLEFGCQGGNSLRMWEDYFRNGEFYGVDLDEKCKAFETDRTHIIVGNAVAESTHSILSQIGTFDIIIDDASHAWGEQRTCLEYYWDLLNVGGYYIVEDLECGCYGEYYNKGYTPDIVDRAPFFEYALDISKVLRWGDVKRYREKTYWEERPKEFANIQETLDSMYFSHSIIIFRKREKTDKEIGRG